MLCTSRTFSRSASAVPMKIGSIYFYGKSGRGIISTRRQTVPHACVLSCHPVSSAYLIPKPSYVFYPPNTPPISPLTEPMPSLPFLPFQAPTPTLQDHPWRPGRPSALRALKCLLPHLLLFLFLDLRIIKLQRFLSACCRRKPLTDFLTYDAPLLVLIVMHSIAKSLNLSRELAGALIHGKVDPPYHPSTA